jgi:hypothetical protein
MSGEQRQHSGAIQTQASTTGDSIQNNAEIRFIKFKMGHEVSAKWVSE